MYIVPYLLKSLFSTESTFFFYIKKFILFWEKDIVMPKWECLNLKNVSFNLKNIFVSVRVKMKCQKN